MKMNGERIVLECLKLEGVDTIFGIAVRGFCPDRRSDCRRSQSAATQKRRVRVDRHADQRDGVEVFNLIRHALSASHATLKDQARQHGRRYRDCRQAGTVGRCKGKEREDDHDNVSIALFSRGVSRRDLNRS